MRKWRISYDLFSIPEIQNISLWTGETDDASIKALRSRQMKNFHLALMVSQVNCFMIAHCNQIFVLPANAHRRLRLFTSEAVSLLIFTFNFVVPLTILSSEISFFIFCMLQTLSYFFLFPTYDQYVSKAPNSVSDQIQLLQPYQS